MQKTDICSSAGIIVDSELQPIVIPRLNVPFGTGGLQPAYCQVCLFSFVEHISGYFQLAIFFLQKEELTVFFGNGLSAGVD